MANNQPDEIHASELTLAEGVARVQVPQTGGGNEYVCPNCERPIPNRRLVYLAKPPQHAHLLNDILKCPWCRFCWSPRSEVTVLRA